MTKLTEAEREWLAKMPSYGSGEWTRIDHGVDMEDYVCVALGISVDVLMGHKPMVRCDKCSGKGWLKELGACATTNDLPTETESVDGGA